MVNLKDMRTQHGQGMTEYIIIVALIAIAAIGSFKYFGQTARSQTAAAAKELAGENGHDMNQKASQAAAGAVKNQKEKNMASFATNNGENN